MRVAGAPDAGDGQVRGQMGEPRDEGDPQTVGDEVGHHVPVQRVVDDVGGEAGRTARREHVHPAGLSWTGAIQSSRAASERSTLRSPASR